MMEFYEDFILFIFKIFLNNIIEFINDSQNENSNKSNYLNENLEQNLQPQREIVVEINEEM